MIFFCMICMTYGKVYHGMSMQMTTEGTGIYYKQLRSISNITQLTGDAGIRLKNIKQKIDMFGIINEYQTVIDVIVGYRYEYFSVKAEGGIKPIIILGTGGMAKIKSFSKVNMIGPWMIQYILGLGVQFYNGRILNEITIKYIQSKITKGQAAFQLAFYWK